MKPSRHNAIDIDYALRQASPGSPLHPVEDRKFWSGVTSNLSTAERAEASQRAEEAVLEPIPVLPASLYLQFLRTGRREGYETPMRQRRSMLAALMVGELLEGDGRFTDAILDLAWAICEEGSWAMPAHQRELADPTHPVIDLGAAMTALHLGELVSLFGNALDPALPAMIRHQVDWRILAPYLTRHDHHWMHNTTRRTVNNWTAVCSGGVAGAAIHLEDDPARLAEILARAARSLEDYLDTFDPDGGSSEGPGYWSYGFGYYTLLAHLVEHRTAGHIDFLADERIPQIARYPLRTQLSPRRYVPFSDCDPNIGFIASHLAYLADRLDIPDLHRLAAEQDPGRRSSEPTWALRDLIWRPQSSQAFVPAAHDWFSGMMWMLARADPADPTALTVAVKGGHNGEMHNQNDVGSLVVHLGGESLVSELGRGRYTKAYFGPTRYDHFVNSSLGHSVPEPASRAQVPGREHAATLLEHRADTETDVIRLDLTGAYPVEAGLTRLERTLQLHRTDSGPWVELIDDVEFGDGPATFQTALITESTVTQEKSTVRLAGQQAALRVTAEPADTQIRIDTHEVDFPQGLRNIQRITFAAAPTNVTTAQIRLRLEPEDL